MAEMDRELHAKIDSVIEYLSDVVRSLQESLEEDDGEPATPEADEGP